MAGFSADWILVAGLAGAPAFIVDCAMEVAAGPTPLFPTIYCRADLLARNLLFHPHPASLAVDRLGHGFALHGYLYTHFRWRLANVDSSIQLAIRHCRAYCLDWDRMDPLQFCHGHGHGLSFT